MPGVLNMLATLHGLGGDSIIGGPYGSDGNSDPMGLTPSVSSPVAQSPDGGVASNIMQALNPAPAPAAPDPNAPAPAAAPGNAPAAPGQKHSLLSILGGIADAVAVAGGAHPGYQPTIDAATARANAVQDRATAASDHARQINMDDLKMQLMQNQAQTAASDAEKSKEGNAIQYVQAVQAAGGDTGAAWAKAAGLAGVSPERTSIIGQMIAADPTNEHGTLEGLDALRNGIEEYNTAPVQAYNPKTGEYEIVQVGKHGGKNVTKLDDGFTIPSNSAVQVDAGGVKKVIDPRTGRVLATANVTASPDQVAGDASRERVAFAGDASRERVASGADASRERVAAAKGTGAAGKGGVDPYTAYTGARSATVRMRDAINDLVNDPNLSSATGYVAGGVDTPARQRILGKVAAIKGMAVPVATALLKAQGVQRPAQAEVLSTANGIISDLGLIRQSTGDYATGARKASAALTERIAGLDGDARRTGIAGGGRPAAAPAPAPARRPVLPAPAGVRVRQPLIRNW